MTEKQKRRLLKCIKHKELKRTEIVKFCTGDTGLERDREISSFCSKKLICMASEPVLENGIFKAQSE